MPTVHRCSVFRRLLPARGYPPPWRRSSTITAPARDPPSAPGRSVPTSASRRTIMCSCMSDGTWSFDRRPSANPTAQSALVPRLVRQDTQAQDHGHDPGKRRQHADGSVEQAAAGGGPPVRSLYGTTPNCLAVPRACAFPTKNCLHGGLVPAQWPSASSLTPAAPSRYGHLRARDLAPTSVLTLRVLIARRFSNAGPHRRPHGGGG